MKQWEWTPKIAVFFIVHNPRSNWMPHCNRNEMLKNATSKVINAKRYWEQKKHTPLDVKMFDIFSSSTIKKIPFDCREKVGKIAPTMQFHGLLEQKCAALVGYSVDSSDFDELWMCFHCLVCWCQISHFHLVQISTLPPQTKCFSRQIRCNCILIGNLTIYLPDSDALLEFYTILLSVWCLLF